MSRIRMSIFGLLFAAFAGCGTAPDSTNGTGAKAASLRYFQALIRQDFAEAYAALAPESKAKVTPEQFAKLAKEYLRGLGFEAKTVHIHTCDEHAAEAIANVWLSGAGRHRHRFKDTIVLRRDASGWAVVLPAKFGKSR